MSPIFGSGCAQEQPAPLQIRAEVACGNEERDLEYRDARFKVRGQCEGGEVRSVELRIPCGSHRFQQHCMLTLQVPSTTSIARSSTGIPIEIKVSDRGQAADVEIKRAEKKE